MEGKVERKGQGVEEAGRGRSAVHPIVPPCPYLVKWEETGVRVRRSELCYPLVVM